MAALAGGWSAQRPSISSSAATVRLARSASIASTPRGLLPLSGNDRPSTSASTRPRTRISTANCPSFRSDRTPVRSRDQPVRSLLVSARDRSSRRSSCRSSTTRPSARSRSRPPSRRPSPTPSEAESPPEGGLPGGIERGSGGPIRFSLPPHAYLRDQSAPQLGSRRYSFHANGGARSAHSRSLFVPSNRRLLGHAGGHQSLLPGGEAVDPEA